MAEGLCNQSRFALGTSKSTEGVDLRSHGVYLPTIFNTNSGFARFWRVLGPVNWTVLVWSGGSAR